MDVVGNISYDGSAMVLNTTAGWLAQLLMIAKPSTFGWRKRPHVKPLGSFFPLGFLAPPDCVPPVDVMVYFLFFSFLTPYFLPDMVRV